MNDQQFDALFGVLTKIAESYDQINKRLAMLTVAYISINDPDGWEEAADEVDAMQKAESEEDCDLGGVA